MNPPYLVKQQPDVVEARLISRRDALAAAAIKASAASIDAEAASIDAAAASIDAAAASIDAAAASVDARVAVDAADATLDDYYYALAAVEKAEYDFKVAKEAEAVATKYFDAQKAVFHNANASIAMLQKSAHVAMACGVLVQIEMSNPFKRTHAAATETVLRCIRATDAARNVLDDAFNCVSAFDDDDDAIISMSNLQQQDAKKPKLFL